jgi:hypothetical protein
MIKKVSIGTSPGASPLRARDLFCKLLIAVICCLTLSACSTSEQRPLTKDQLRFFESKIRPIFADNCYKCHSPSKVCPKPDWNWIGRRLAKGGGYGPVIIPGDPDKSELIQAVRLHGQ